jgi:hypothetical protein
MEILVALAFTSMGCRRRRSTLNSESIKRIIGSTPEGHGFQLPLL